MSAENSPNTELVKWEYLRVMAQLKGTPYIFGNYTVVSANGQTLNNSSLNFDEYAKQKGEEGWEMVGVSSLGETFHLVVMFKKQK